jgi:hypothetical protein
MTDPSQTRQPTREELEAHLAQLRQADVDEVVVQAVNMLATGAQVKLGRSDARVLIDAMKAIADSADGRVDADVVKQIQDAVGQLQMAQVQAERETAAASAPGGPDAPPGTTGRPEAPGQAAEDEAGGRMTDRLWIPGREPNQG